MSSARSISSGTSSGSALFSASMSSVRSRSKESSSGSSSTVSSIVSCVESLDSRMDSSSGSSCNGFSISMSSARSISSGASECSSNTDSPMSGSRLRDSFSGSFSSTNILDAIALSDINDSVLTGKSSCLRSGSISVSKVAVSTSISFGRSSLCNDFRFFCVILTFSSISSLFEISEEVSGILADPGGYAKKISLHREHLTLDPFSSRRLSSRLKLVLHFLQVIIMGYPVGYKFK